MKKILLLLALLPLLARGQIIVTVAGTGAEGFNGDGMAATATKLWNPDAMTMDRAGNLYFNDGNNVRLRKVSPAYGGTITTIAGNGISGTTNDGVPATSTGCYTVDIAIDKHGNFFLADYNEHKIRKITTDGIIRTYAGTGTSGYNGDGIPATTAQIHTPMGVAVDDTGNVYVTDALNYRIRKIDTFGIITTIAGNGVAGYCPDGGRADTASLLDVRSIRFGFDGRLYFTANARIRTIMPDGTISTLGGNGTYGYSGDGGPAVEAKIHPVAVWIDSFSNIFLAEAFSNRVRKIGIDGIINTIAGTGVPEYGGDWGDPLLAKVNGPSGIVVTANGDVFFADRRNHRIRMITTHVTEVAQQTIVGSGFAVYPNPATGSITVAMPQTTGATATISICNAYGQLMTTVQTCTNAATTLPTHWPPGIYFVTARTTQQTYHATVEVR
jgi:hypothetical protein